MNARAIGHGGNIPVFQAKKGSEIRDPKTGKVVRHEEMGPTNIAVDRLEWLLAHKRIEAHHHAAGRQLQRDSELAQLESFATLSGGGGGGGDGGMNRLSDIKCDAIAAVNRARTAFKAWPEMWRLLELVVIDNVSLEKASARMRRPPKWGGPALCDALEALAVEYGLSNGRRK